MASAKLLCSNRELFYISYMLPSFIVSLMVAGWWMNYTVPDTVPNTEPVVKCENGVPCQYPETVDFRVIVLAYNRSKSLVHVLSSLQSLQLDGSTARLEIWIDKDENNKLDNDTYKVASSFEWNNGPVRVHVHSKHAGLYMQWLYTWRPLEGSKEMVMYLEDDVDASPYAYRWLKLLHQKYSSYNSIGAITLQDDYTMVVYGKKKGIRLDRPQDQPIFLFGVFEPWGFSPVPKVWRDFQDWYIDTRRKTKSFEPIVEGIELYSSWYSANTDNMWHMWFIYYLHVNDKMVLHSNLPVYLGREDDCSLVVHRRETGIHFMNREPVNSRKRILTTWDGHLEELPDEIVKVQYDGSIGY